MVIVRITATAAAATTAAFSTPRLPHLCYQLIPTTASAKATAAIPQMLTSRMIVVPVLALALVRLGASVPRWLNNVQNEFREPYGDDFQQILASRHLKRVPADDLYEWADDPRRAYDLYEDMYNLVPDARSEYPESNMVNSLNGQEMKVAGGNGANGAFNEFPVSLLPGAAEQEQGGQEQYNPYPSPPNPCPLPYPDEEGNIKPYTLADDCIPQWRDEADLSKAFQEQQVGKGDDEHNGAPPPEGMVKKASHPHYLKSEERRESIRAKKG